MKCWIISHVHLYPYPFLLIQSLLYTYCHTEIWNMQVNDRAPKIVEFFYIKLGIVTGVITSCTVHIIFRKLDNSDQFQNQDREEMRKK